MCGKYCRLLPQRRVLILILYYCIFKSKTWYRVPRCEPYFPSHIPHSVIILLPCADLPIFALQIVTPITDPHDIPSERALFLSYSIYWILSRPSPPHSKFPICRYPHLLRSSRIGRNQQPFTKFPIAPPLRLARQIRPVALSLNHSTKQGCCDNGDCSL